MARRLNIAVWYDLFAGGAKRALYYHVQGLVERGHIVETWRPPEDTGRFSSFDNLVNEHEVPEHQPHTEGSTYIGKIVRHVRRSQQLLEGIEQHCQTCAAEINQGRWDVLFANGDKYLNMPMIGRYVSIPKAVYLQEPHRSYYEAQPTLPWLALPEEIRRGHKLQHLKARIRDRYDLASLRIRAREELESARSFDKILVNSLYSRESVLKAYGIDSEVCYLGIDTAKFTDFHLERGRTVVGLGAIVPPKNVRLAIESIGAMHTPKPSLVWVGNFADPAYLHEMRSLAESLGVDFQTRVMVTDEELVDLLNHASLMFYAPHLEPFGLAPLEANACGLPVVAVAEGGVRETIIDGINGKLVQHDPKALADAMSALMEDPAKLRSMGLEARKLVNEKWNLSSCVDHIEDALLKVAG